MTCSGAVVRRISRQMCEMRVRRCASNYNVSFFAREPTREKYITITFDISRTINSIVRGIYLGKIINVKLARSNFTSFALIV